jgi:hypothetical protein
MANGGGRSIADVKSDLSSISRSVSEGNMKGQPSSPIYKGSKGGDGGMKGGSKTKKY